MRIRAIRCLALGVLDSATALENLSGRLDVVSAPNEAGKSTLFRGLTTALTTPYSANTRAVRDLQPSGGGAPTVEVELEIDGEHWVLTKRFLVKPRARLLQAGGGRPLENADAEAHLATLVRHSLGGQDFRPVLWVGQGASVAPVELSPASAASFRTALATEIAEATGSQLADRVRQRVRRRLDELVTPTGRTKMRGPLDLAEKAAAAAIATHADAEALAREMSDLRRELQRLKEAEAELTSPATTAARIERVAALRQQQASSEAARTRLTHAEAAFRAADERSQRARGDLRRHDDQVARLTVATEAIGRIAPEVEHLGSEVATTSREQAAASAAVAKARRIDLDRQRAALSARLAHAARAAAAVDAAEAAAQTVAVDPDTLERARALERELATLDIELAASAATLAVRLDQAGLDRLRIGGLPPRAASDLIPIDREIVIEIDGIGTLTVTPGGGRARDDLVERRGHTYDSLAACLARLSVATLAEAEARLAKATEQAQRSREAQVGLAAALGGQTRQSLEQQEARLRRALAALPPGGDDPGGDVDLHTAEEALATVTTRLESARARHRDTIRRLEELRTEVRLLAGDVPAADRRDEVRRDLEGVLATAETEQRRVAIEVGAMREQCLAPDEAARLATDLAAAERELQEAAREAGRLRQAVAEINGRLIQHEMAGGRTGDLADLLAMRDSQVRARDRLRDELEALRILEEQFSAAEAEDHRLVVAPIEARLAPYLARVLPQARVDWSEGLGMTRLTRGATDFAIDRLSVGTREQVSILVRLAFAEVLADRGQPLPVILDDALVHADAGRRRGMFDALSLAARRFQVIVLTCHDQFATELAERHGATCHAFEPWTGATWSSAA